MLYFFKALIKLTRDSILPASPEKILLGERMFRPFLRYQESWLKYCYLHDIFLHDKNAWFYLQKYMMPLIYQHASSYHVEGIQRLKLNTQEEPDFDEFQDLFYKKSNGFEIHAVNKEIEPLEYFDLISKKKFPCVPTMRSLEETFCANEPDFWHEAIGHIAPLCHRRVQDFYLEIAHYMLTAKSKDEFNNNLAVAWTLTEYGFLKEEEQPKFFGAALVGSHLANWRYLKGVIAIELAKKCEILQSGFYAEEKDFARNDKGQFRFFCLKDFDLKGLFS